MRVVSTLNEAIAQNSHLVEFECVGRHDVKQILQTILQEVQFGLLRVHIEQSVCDDGQSLHNQLNNVETLLRSLSASRTLGGKSWVHLSERTGEERKKVR